MFRKKPSFYGEELLEDACPNCLYISKKFFSGAHSNFEEQNKVLEAPRIVITYHIFIIVIVSAYNNFIINA
jgi:hypothetical protein